VRIFVNTTSCVFFCQEQNNEDLYHGIATDHNALLQWANEKCVPLVRELTFENAEVIVYVRLIVFSIYVQLFKVLVATILLAE